MCNGRKFGASGRAANHVMEQAWLVKLLPQVLCGGVENRYPLIMIGIKEQKMIRRQQLPM